MSLTSGKQLFLSIVALLSVFLISIETFAAGEGNHDHKKSANIGTPGKESEVTRIVKVSMFDHYFQPQSLTVPRNACRFLHLLFRELVPEPADPPDHFPK